MTASCWRGPAIGIFGLLLMEFCFVKIHQKSLFVCKFLLKFFHYMFLFYKIEIGQTKKINPVHLKCWIERTKWIYLWEKEQFVWNYQLKIFQPNLAFKLMDSSQPINIFSIKYKNVIPENIYIFSEEQSIEKQKDRIKKDKEFLER